MLEIRLNNDFSLVGKFATKIEALKVVNEKINDVLIDDAILIFDGVKLVFSRNGKKNQVKKNNLNVIYIALIAKKAENIILKNGFKNVLSLANTLSKGVKRNKKALIFKACYLALKNLDMDYMVSNPINNSKWIEVTKSEVNSVINKGVVYTVFSIVKGLRFIPVSKRYIVMRYTENELAVLAEKYNFNILLVG